MLEFLVLTGNQAGSVLPATQFPCRIGRATDAELRFDDPGVWDQHVEIEIRSPDGVVARLCPPALASVNGTSFEEVVLHGGDRLEIGSVHLRFGLAAPRQSAFWVREALTWGGLGLLCLAQLAILYWLSR
jgi:hypothetical protein